MKTPTEISKIFIPLKGLKCWHVSSGGAAGSTIQLALGNKIERSIPLKNRAHSDEFRRFEGEASLLVWCAWRLDGPDRPLTSWDDAEESIDTGLAQLVGTQITSLEVLAPAWDLSIEFSNSLVLRVFCDHVPGEPSFHGNWDLRTRTACIAMGPGATFKIEDRTQVSQEA